MELFEKTLHEKTIYDGKILRLHVDDIELPNGSKAIREIVEHPGGVTVLPVDENGLCTMVRQFRYPFGRMMLEAPAGKLERGEDPKESAVRATARTAAFMPGASPPLVSTPILLIVPICQSSRSL